MAYLEMSRMLPWFEEPSQGIETDSIQTLINLWIDQRDITEWIVALSWINDGVDQSEAGAFQRFLEVAVADVALGEKMLGLLWINDGLTEAELMAFEDIADVAIEDAELAKEVMDLPWLMDGVSREEASAIRELRSIFEEDPEVAGEIARLGWHTDGISQAEVIALGSIAGTFAGNRELAGELTALDWFVDGIQDGEAETLSALARFADESVEIDAGLLERITALSWVVDGVTDFEEGIIRFALMVQGRDPELANTIIELPWVSDGVVDYEGITIDTLNNIASEDLEFAIDVASLPWFGERVSRTTFRVLESLYGVSMADRELAKQVMTLEWVKEFATNGRTSTLDRLSRIAAEDAAFAREIASLPWFNEGATSSTPWILTLLFGIASADPEVGRKAANIPWLGGDATNEETDIIQVLNVATSIDAELGNILVSLPWISADEPTPESNEFILQLLRMVEEDAGSVKDIISLMEWMADGVSDDESQVFQDLFRVISDDPVLGRELLNLPWIQDDEITGDERLALSGFQGIANEDIELARHVKAFPWLNDDISTSEAEAVRDLSRIVENAPEIARALMSTPRLEDGFESLLNSYVLAELSKSRSDVLELLGGEEWFLDGLNDEEAALVVTFGAAKEIRLVEDLVRSHTIEHKSISLPLAGDVNIWIVYNVPPMSDEGIMKDIEDTARIFEEYIGVPFPTTDIVLFVIAGTTQNYIIGSGHHGDFMVMDRRYGEIFFVPHETGHYYFHWNFSQAWLREGGANFVETMVHYKRGYQSVAERRSRVATDVQTACNSNGIENILHNQELVNSGEVSFFLCTYSMGERFLLSMMKVLGEEGMSLAMRELYLNSVGEGGIQRNWTPPSEEEIFETFMRHAEEGREEEVRELYQMLHGGLFAFPFGEVEGEDQHGNELEEATRVRLHRPFFGAINDEADYDYFRFITGENERFSFSFHGDFLDGLCSKLFHGDGTEVPDWPNPCDGGETPQFGESLDIEWNLPQGGVYYLALYGSMGSTGGYKLQIKDLD